MRGKLIQIAIIIFLVIFAVNTVRQLVRLNLAKDKLQKAEQKLSNLKSQNESFKKELTYRQTPDFVEKAARDQLGLVKQGETVVVLPKAEEQTQGQSKRTSNFKGWIDRLFGS